MVPLRSALPCNSGKIQRKRLLYSFVQQPFWQVDDLKWPPRCYGHLQRKAYLLSLIHIYPVHQNVIWTLLLGILGIHLMETVRKKQKTGLYLLVSALVVVAGAVLGTLGMVDSVSYTHLDVYKRQGKARPPAFSGIFS